jgi:hypothetical protein
MPVVRMVSCFLVDTLLKVGSEPGFRSDTSFEKQHCSESYSHLINLTIVDYSLCRADIQARSAGQLPSQSSRSKN